VIIADEASALKSPEARRTKAMLALADRAERRWAMSGTPRGAQLLDLWGPSQFCTAGVAFPPFNVWRSVGFVPVDQYLRYWRPRAGVEALVVERMTLFTRVIGREALAQRPPVTEILRDVALPTEAADLYAQLDGGTTEDLRALIAEGIEPPREMGIVGKLQQVLSGALYKPDGSWRLIHDARLDVLEALHAGHDRPTLVYVAFRHEIERIQARLPQARELTPDLVEPWNRGEIELLLAHPQAAAHGLNLQYGSNVIVFFSLGWSAERYEQAVARVARQGQRDPVTVHVLVTDGAIDTIAWQVIQRRIRDQARTVAAIDHMTSRGDLPREECEPVAAPSADTLSKGGHDHAA
jgi:SNF2 family DNA or RNA helicase